MKMKIRAKLFFGFALVLLMMISAGGYLYFELRTITSSYNQLIDERAKKVSLSKGMIAAFSQEVIYVRSFLYSGDSQYIQKYYNSAGEFNHLINEIGPMVKDNEEQQLIKDIVFTRDTFENQAVRTIAMKGENMQAGLDPKAIKESEEEINKVLKRGTSVVQETLNAMQVFVDRNQRLLDEGKLQNIKEVDRALILVVIMFLAALATGLLIAAIMARHISLPIFLLDREVGRIAGGDLTGRSLAIKNKDEIGSLAASFNKMLSNLKNIVGLVENTARTVAVSSKDLSAAAQQTSAAASDTASNIGQVSGAVQQVSGNAGAAAVASEAATSYTVGGGESIERVIQQMEAIRQSAGKASAVVSELVGAAARITEMVKMITGIADQTNLLALNAAIEAARAGEHGRGFTVVAEEVRKLAEKSAGAAREIRNLTGVIQEGAERATASMQEGEKEVVAGTAIAREAGDSFTNINEIIQGLNTKIHDVAAAAEEISAGVQSVAGATEEQAATVEEISTSAESLARVAEDLRLAVEGFKLGEQDGLEDLPVEESSDNKWISRFGIFTRWNMAVARGGSYIRSMLDWIFLKIRRQKYK